MTKPKSIAATIAVTLALGACSMAPTYKPPAAPVAEH